MARTYLHSSNDSISSDEESFELIDNASSTDDNKHEIEQFNRDINAVVHSLDLIRFDEPVGDRGEEVDTETLGQLTSCTRKGDRWKEEWRMMEKEMEEMREEREREMERMSEMKECQRRNEEEKEQMKEEQVRLEDVNHQLEIKLAVAMKDMMDMKEEVERLKEKNEILEKEKEMQKMHDNIIKEKYEESQKWRHDVEIERSEEICRAVDEINQLEEELEMMKKKLEETITNYKEANGEVVSMRNQTLELKKELDASVAVSSQATSDAMESATRVRLLEQTIQSLYDELNETQSEKNEIEGERDELRFRASSMTSMMEKIQGQNKILATENAQLKWTLAECETKIEMITANCDRLHSTTPHCETRSVSLTTAPNGFFALSTIGVAISHVEEGGPADLNGVKRGDQIIAIDGINVETFPEEQISEMFSRGRDNGSVTILLRHNEERLRDLEYAWNEAISLSSHEREKTDEVSANQRTVIMSRGSDGCFGFSHIGTSISKVDEGWPAAREGVQEGDQIMAIDGVNVETFSKDLISTLFKSASESISILLRYNPERLRDLLYM